MGANLDLPAAEVGAAVPGAEAATGRLSDLLLIAALRAWIAAAGDRGGLLPLLSPASTPPMAGHSASKAPPTPSPRRCGRSCAGAVSHLPRLDARAMAPTWWSDPRAFEQAFAAA